MRESDFRFLARELRMMKTVTDDLTRLRFAIILRDAFQFSKNWPGMNEFMRMSDIPEHTGVRH